MSSLILFLITWLIKTPDIYRKGTFTFTFCAHLILNILKSIQFKIAHATNGHKACLCNACKSYLQYTLERIILFTAFVELLAFDSY